jgi:hypothetical protein
LDRLLHRASRLTAEDAAELRRSGSPDEELWRFVVAREAARIFADDKLMVPLEQLDRIFSPEIAPRIRPLQLDFRPDASAQEGLPAEARAWFERLLKEQDIQRRRHDREQREKQQARKGWRDPEEYEERPRASLQNDARALAYFLWVVGAFANPKDRFVFVTGDRLLFDAYRRWHISRPSGEPFVMRRLIQFAPFINLNDSPNDISNARVLFDRTRGAVEVALMAFNLASGEQRRPTAEDAVPHAARERERLLLPLSEAEDLAEDLIIKWFLGRLGEQWMQGRIAELKELRSDWRKVERMSIGANYHLISQRLDRTQRQRAEAIVGKGPADATALVSYLQRLLDRIFQNSIKLWVPLAADFIKSSQWPSHAARAARSQRRVPIALRLRVPLPPGRRRDSEPAYKEVDELLEDWGKGDDSAREILDAEHNPLFAEQKYFVFGIAATMALRMDLWSQAERYADLANLAVGPPSDSAKPDNPLCHDSLECMYLKALASRFRIGSFPPHGARLTENVWRKWLDAAVKILDRCESLHAKNHHVLREMRTVSERAAIRLFYAAWVATAPNAPHPLFTVEDAYREFEAGAHDLRRCLTLESGARDAARDSMRQSFFHRLERQYVTNCAAAEVIAHLFFRNHGIRTPESVFAENDLLMERILDWTERAQGTSLPAVARLDLEAFLVLRRVHAVDKLREVVRDAPNPNLAIDQAVLQAISKFILQE